MSQLAIQPTVTQKVRAFLEAQGTQLRPWSPLDEVYVELHDLLRRRRADPAFWGPLEALIGDVVESAVDPRWVGRLPAPQAELLSAADLRTLVADLRAALALEESRGVAGVRRFTAGLSAGVLGAFLLLGAAAAGCGTGGEVAPLDDPPREEVRALAEAEQAAASQPEQAAASQPEQAAAPVETAAEPATAACALDRGSPLFRAIDASALDDPAKRGLCACFADLNRSWAEGLTALFEQGEPAQVAAALERMIALCDLEEGEGAAPSELTGDFASANDGALRLPSGAPARQQEAATPRRQRAEGPGRRDRPLTIRPVPLYRGVSFRS